MQAMRGLFVGVAFTAVMSLGGCRGVQAPYPPSQPPAVEDLLAVTAPVLSSVQVPRAKVRQGAGPAANLMIVAQAPARFAGTIQISGNELVTLAVNENQYGLRWLAGREGSDTLASGYYSGPPSRCAVETLLGVDLEPDAFVELVLGGAPMIDGPHDVVDRRWDRKTARERLTISNGRHQQELAFAWIAGHWQFAGATLWSLGAAEPVWLWTISHEALHEVGGHTLPAKTQIRRPKPNGKGELLITVTFQKQIPNPKLGGELLEDPPIDVTEDDSKPANAGDSWDDDWDSDEGWEDSDDETQNPDEGAAPSSPDPTPSSAPSPVETPQAVVEIPAQFIGNPTGLTARGDLCAGRR